MSFITRLDPIITGIIVVTVLVIGGIVLSFNSSGGPAIPQYKIGDTARPQIVVSETDFDFGQVNLSDTVTKEIQVQNKGDETLILSNVITSCDCTFAQFVIDGEISPRFSMRGDRKWQEEVAPNDSVILKVIYQPSIMPVKGAVSRTVFFKTNDPQNPSVNINFTAYVE